VALQIAEKVYFDPFRSSHDVRINLRSVAQTPVRTVSEGAFSEVPGGKQCQDTHRLGCAKLYYPSYFMLGTTTNAAGFP
jgi:hypothetical protein